MTDRCENSSVFTSLRTSLFCVATAGLATVVKHVLFLFLEVVVGVDLGVQVKLVDMRIDVAGLVHALNNHPVQNMEDDPHEKQL